MTCLVLPPVYHAANATPWEGRVFDGRRYDRQGIAIQLEEARLLCARPGRMPSDININDKPVIALEPIAARVRHHSVEQGTCGSVPRSVAGSQHRQTALPSR